MDRRSDAAGRRLVVDDAVVCWVEEEPGAADVDPPGRPDAVRSEGETGAVACPDA